MLTLKAMLTTIILIISIVWFALALALYYFQESLVYYPDTNLSGNPGDIGIAHEEVFLKTRDGILIHGWHIPGPESSHTLLFFHGNAGNISDRLQSIRIFHELGLSVLIIDYRGYGKSEGYADEDGTYIDAETAWHYLIEKKGLSADDIVIFGRSLGGGVATWLARHRTPAALILESTFSSIPAMAAELYPYFPTKLLSRIQYANIDRVALVDAPILLMHSPDDDLIPYQQGQILYQRAKQPKSFIDISGAHNGGFLTNTQSYTAGIKAFLDEHLVPN